MGPGSECSISVTEKELKSCSGKVDGPAYEHIQLAVGVSIGKSKRIAQNKRARCGIRCVNRGSEISLAVI
ncbi:MAG: hypothetical protein DMG49_23425 [Acidobacteria bacterium]|nr:MAG: hypothetical protein DMG49_23425 [Acidobacteriota bacterium]